MSRKSYRNFSDSEITQNRGNGDFVEVSDVGLMMDKNSGDSCDAKNCTQRRGHT